MAENSKIEWTDHTFNPWIGCTKVSPACDNCYAERDWDHRFGRVQWGPGQPRSRTSVQNWNKPLAWDTQAAKTGVRPKVFCASLADVFDVEVPLDWRHALFKLIGATPNLDWLLLTKRPNVARRWFETAPEDWEEWPNVWLGTTVENQHCAEARIPDLLATPGVAKRFLSMEPLLGPVTLNEWLLGPVHDCTDCPGSDSCECYGYPRSEFSARCIDWIIVGGESGPEYRELNLGWANQLVEEADTARVPFFMKQMSGNTPAARKDIPPELMLRELPS